MEYMANGKKSGVISKKGEPVVSSVLRTPPALMKVTQNLEAIEDYDKTMNAQEENKPVSIYQQLINKNRIREVSGELRNLYISDQFKKYEGLIYAAAIAAGLSQKKPSDAKDSNS
jgi:hypothetical protein